ncbi:MAG: ParA family protein [Deltaproteobacteria bacterium]|nr:ParA family protein [Deltaproteobacteria bacterium]
MKIGIVDIRPESRAALVGRVQLAAKEASIRDFAIVELDLAQINSWREYELQAVYIGPGTYSKLAEIVDEIRVIFPNIPLALVLENEIYANKGVSLRKRFNVEVMPLGDLAHIAGFLIDCEEFAHDTSAIGSGIVLSVAQLKGGVGATTLTAALASCWAHCGLSVAIIDLDDVNPQITNWAKVKFHRREVTSEFLRNGNVPPERVNELLAPVDGFDGKLVVVGQPARYNEGFHFKADVIEGAPSSVEFTSSLIDCLSSEFDLVIIDLGRSWGVSTFTSLMMSREVLLVTDDDGMSVRQTLDNLERLKSESGDSGEFDFTKWNIVLNAYSGRLITPEVLASEVNQMDLLPQEASLFTIPFSEKGRQWGAPGQTLFELGEDYARESLLKLASAIYPIGYTQQQGVLQKVVGKIKSIVQ